MRIATASQMRELDRITIQERGVPSTDLMERAAAALAQAALELAGGAPGRAVCFCGPGNNGGDGVACARLLREAGLEVRCVLVGRREKLTPDTRAMEARLAAVRPRRRGLRLLVPGGGCDGGCHLRHRPEQRRAGGRPYRHPHDEHLRHPGGVRRHPQRGGDGHRPGAGGGGAGRPDGDLHPAQGGPLCGQGRPVHRPAHRGGHRHPGGAGGRGGLPRPHGGGGGHLPARPTPGRPQGGFRQGVHTGRQRGLHRRAGAGRPGGGALRRGTGDGGGARPGLAGGGGQAG